MMKIQMMKIQNTEDAKLSADKGATVKLGKHKLGKRDEKLPAAGKKTRKKRGRLGYFRPHRDKKYDGKPI